MKCGIKTVLVPVDFSPCSLRAVVPAIELARICDGRIVLLHVLELRSSTAPPFYFSIPPPLELEEDLRDISNSHLEQLAMSIRKQGVAEVETHTVPGTPYAEIVKVIPKYDADLVVMGTHGASGFNEFFIGTNAARVVSRAACPVLTIQEQGEARPFSSIVLPFGKELPGEDALGYAILLAKSFSAAIHLLHVQERGALPLNGAADDLAGRLKNEGITCVRENIAGSFQARQVIGYAERQTAGLILLENHHDENSFADFFKGPFTQQIVNHSHIPVLTVPDVNGVRNQSPVNIETRPHS